jgi:hypothetical protein
VPIKRTLKVDPVCAWMSRNNRRQGFHDHADIACPPNTELTAAGARLLACSRIIRLHPMLLNPLITNRKRRALMMALLCFFLTLFASLFKSKSRLEAENAALRHQLIVLQRRVSGHVQLANGDRLFLVMLYRWFPSILKAITIIRPETLVRWHRAGFRRYWRWKSRNLGGRPQISADLRALIRRMSVENLLWGAPRIHGELLKLGFSVAQSTVAKYMAKKGDPAGQRWSTFLRNHALHIAAMDLFVVPTIGFNLLYVLVIVRLARRELVWLNVTAHPTAEWIAPQITEAFPWNVAPRYIIRDQDAIYGAAVTRRLRAMGTATSPLPQARHGRTVLPRG